jgi:hypothetical protein
MPWVKRKGRILNGTRDVWVGGPTIKVVIILLRRRKNFHGTLLFFNQTAPAKTFATEANESITRCLGSAARSAATQKQTAAMRNPMPPTLRFFLDKALIAMQAKQACELCQGLLLRPGLKQNQHHRCEIFVAFEIMNISSPVGATYPHPIMSPIRCRS